MPYKPRSQGGPMERMGEISGQRRLATFWKFQKLTSLFCRSRCHRNPVWASAQRHGFWDASVLFQRLSGGLYSRYVRPEMFWFLWPKPSPVPSINSSALKHLSFSDARGLDELFDHTTFFRSDFATSDHLALTTLRFHEVPMFRPHTESCR